MAKFMTYRTLNLYMTPAEAAKLQSLIDMRQEAGKGETRHGFLVSIVYKALTERQEAVASLVARERVIHRRLVRRSCQYTMAFPKTVARLIFERAHGLGCKEPILVYAAFKVAIGEVIAVHPTIAMLDDKAKLLLGRTDAASVTVRELKAAKFKTSPSYRVPTLDNIGLLAGECGMDPWELIHALGYYAFAAMNRFGGAAETSDGEMAYDPEALEPEEA